MGTVGRQVATVLGALVFLSSCASDPDRVPQTGPSSSPPSPSKKEKLCQPFPDRLIDGFLAAYEDRDLEALTTLVRAGSVHDVTAVGHAGRAEFEDVGEWAREAWAANDRLEPIGYGAFAGSPDGFLMFVKRSNDALRKVGIPELAMDLQARSTGCTIDELYSVGGAQARGAPCRFYEVFGDHPAVAAEEPPGCADGSGAFARMDHAAVWTGAEMVVAGGTKASRLFPLDLWEEGLRYGEAGGWRLTSEAPSAASGATSAVWTGTEVLTWGGTELGAPAAYDPLTDQWRALPGWPLRDAARPPGIWTGSQLVVWGSSMHTDRPKRGGAIYDPATDSWQLTAPAPIGGREGHVAVWTGEEMLVWGGSDFRTDHNEGAAYDPSTDTWRKIAPSPLSPRQEATAVWTGEEMIVWSGNSFSSTRGDGAAYDPSTDVWRRLPRAPIPGRHWHTAVWSGTQMIVWGGHSYRTDEPMGDGAAYDPRGERWELLPPAPITPRCQHSAVWSGSQMVIYGGHDACGTGGHIPFGDGATYDPDVGTWTRLNPAG